MNETPTQRDVYHIVTDQIIAKLKEGIIPWHEPWGTTGVPRKYTTNEPFCGISVWLLGMLHYPHNLFLTWDELKQCGGSVKKGERGHLVVFFNPHTIAPAEEWNWLTKVGLCENPTTIGKLRYYKVFNVAQCTDLAIPPPSTPSHSPLEAAKAIIETMPNCPPLKSGKTVQYDPILDCIIAPHKQRTLVEDTGYCAALFRALVQSTGHKRRLHRSNDAGDTGAYSFEALIGDLGMCYLCHTVGIPPRRPRSKREYSNGWLERLTADRRLIVRASMQAQLAVEYILKIRNEKTGNVALY